LTIITPNSPIGTNRATPTERTGHAELASIEPGSPVVGVRLENPNPSSEIEYVLYPSQVDGLQMEVQRG